MRRSDLYFALLLTSSASLACLPTAAAIDARVRAAMAETCANGMAIAVIDDGRVAHVQAVEDGRCVLRFSGNLTLLRVRKLSEELVETSLTAIEVWPDGGVQVAFVNDTHHLYDPAIDPGPAPVAVRMGCVAPPNSALMSPPNHR